MQVDAESSYLTIVFVLKARCDHEQRKQHLKVQMIQVQLSLCLVTPAFTYSQAWLVWERRIWVLRLSSAAPLTKTFQLCCQTHDFLVKMIFHSNKKKSDAVWSLKNLDPGGLKVGANRVKLLCVHSGGRYCISEWQMAGGRERRRRRIVTWGCFSAGIHAVSHIWATAVTQIFCQLNRKLNQSLAER